MENDYQIEVLSDDNEICDPLLNLPKSIPLMSSKEKLKRRNKKRVVRYHTPNPVDRAEEYTHHLMMLFYPFRNETDLLSEIESSYVIKLNKPDVLDVVNENKTRFEPWGDMVDNVLINANFAPRTDQFAQQENDKTIVLNKKQRFVFEIVNKVARMYVKNRSVDQVNMNPPLHIFITGGAGSGKSHLIKTITASVSKTLCYGSSCIENLLLLAPTGVAAVNINWTTIHSAVDSRGLTLHKLAKRRCKLRQELIC